MKNWLQKWKIVLLEAESTTKEVVNVLNGTPLIAQEADNFTEVKDNVSSDKNLWFVVIEDSSITGSCSMVLDEEELNVEFDSSMEDDVLEILVKTVCAEFRAIENAKKLVISSTDNFKDLLKGKGFIFDKEGNGILEKE